MHVCLHVDPCSDQAVEANAEGVIQVPADLCVVRVGIGARLRARARVRVLSRYQQTCVVRVRVRARFRARVRVLYRTTAQTYDYGLELGREL